MSVVWHPKIFLALLFARNATASAGDDFSNNLFSDLAPLLALFGERVTMQFMSQSMGWADNVILAMAPLGIITAIVGAIRVGGPTWLKAIIGRGRENLAIAEIELMSSTSKEVCELWNGQALVRCMGSGSITEFICLIPQVEATKDAAAVPRVRTMNLEEAQEREYIKKIDLNFRDDFNRWYHRWHTSAQAPDPDLDPSKNDTEQNPPDPSPPEIIIIHNKLAAAPNVSLNSHNKFWRGELRAIAVFATFLQLGVLTYSGLATYYPKWSFAKGKHTSYGFPCNAIGTVILVLGMLVCGHVVESSTKEMRYQPTNGMTARLVWLQQAKTVGDQVFDSFAILPKDHRAIITTSSRLEMGPSASEAPTAGVRPLLRDARGIRHRGTWAARALEMKTHTSGG